MAPRFNRSAALSLSAWCEPSRRYGRSTFITPMAAVAGAVAEEILQSMTANAQLSKAYVNDGGDIALYLSDGEEFSCGMVERPDRPSLFGYAAD